MRGLAIVVLSILALTSGAEAAGTAPECALDKRGTQKSNGMPDHVITSDSELARTLRDFRNAAVNYFFGDQTGIAIRNLLVGPASGFTAATFPICNEVGQCVTTSIAPRFGLDASINIPGTPITFGGNIGTVGYHVVVEDWGGNTDSYETGLTQQRLQVPASGPAGLIYQDKTCRFNDHLEQAPDDASDNGTSGGSGGSGGDLGGDGGATGFPGATPVGGTGLGGGGNCWLFVARTTSGSYIGSYVLCF